MPYKENETPVFCECGKLIAYQRNGKIFVWCKKCKKEIEVADIEPRAVSKE